jgi:hypothetical protein
MKITISKPERHGEASKDPHVTYLISSQASLRFFRGRPACLGTEAAAAWVTRS